MVKGLDYQETTEVDECDFVLLTGPDDVSKTVDRFDAILSSCLKRNLLMICANPDKMVIEKNTLRICAGAIASEYQRRGGLVRYFGKPSASIIKKCLAQFKLAANDKVMMVGDNLLTDILGGNQLGIATTLVCSGIHQHDLMVNGELCLSKINQVCINQQIFPTYVVSHFQFD